MVLESITIDQFKSIKSINLKLLERIYALIGKNETGKSNILQAISCLYSTDHIPEEEKKKVEQILKTASVKLLFGLSAQEILTIRRSSPSILFKKVSYNSKSIKKLEIYSKKNLNETCRYVLINSDGVEIEVDQIEDENKKKIITVLDNIRPSIEYYTGEEFLVKPLKIENLISDPENTSFRPFKRLLQLGGVEVFEDFTNLPIEEIILLRDRVEATINKELQEHYKSEYGLQLSLESHNGELSIFFRDQYGNLSRFSDRSSGFQYFFSFLINKLHANRFGNSGTIYLLDEPGLSLHPSSQKHFIKLLEKISLNNTVIYTTHSPFSLNRMHPTRVWLVERNKELGTYVQHKPYANNWRLLRTSLGITFSDSFIYSEKTLLVEGVEDKLIISTLLHYFITIGKLNLNSDMFAIIEAGSIDNMPAMIQILLDEERPLLAFVDNDVPRTYNRLISKYKKVNNEEAFCVKTVSDIKEDAISIEDLLPYDLYIQAVKNYLALLLNDGIIVLKDHFSIETLFPENHHSKRYLYVAREICKHFSQYGGEELNSKTPISKVGIAHEFAKLINQKMSLNNNGDESVCYRFVSVILRALDLIVDN